MDMGTLKGIELIVIIGLVAWFFMKQRKDLDRAKAETAAKKAEAEDAGKP